MNRLTKKQYFDLLIESSLNGTFASQNETGACFYRGDGGKKCAVGIIIPDEMYYSEHNCCTVIDYPDIEKVIPEGLDVYKLGQIQECHDLNTKNYNKNQTFIEKENWLKEPKIWNHQAFVERLRSLECFKDME